MSVPAVPPSAGLSCLKADAVRRALEHIAATDAETLADQLVFTAIAAPTGDEGPRARALAERLVAAGLPDVTLDAVGNVLGRWPASPAAGERRPALALIAHLDTVFPAGTDLAVRREGPRYVAPGIGDNARGLAGMAAVARAVASARIACRSELLFIGSVGEEGLGNLRGVRHVFEASPIGRTIGQVIAVDGCDARRIVRRAVGSRRYRVTFTGPGGHSWGSAGAPSALNALGDLITRLAALPLPTEPRTTLNVGTAAGGSAVNAVAATAECLLEVRSTGEAALMRLDSAIRGAASQAAEAETRRAAGAPRRGGDGRPPLSAAVELVGARPCGETPADAPLVRAARAATLALGLSPTEPESSTDANVPIARGIPAVTLGAGGVSGGAHTLHEWFENEDGARGVQRLLLVALEAAGVVA
ncbi:MAG TPA: M20/M25/M40 family metallo-hydrolase [Thermodesulfobacteriota bacterium]